MLALTKTVEQGGDERVILANMLACARAVLRERCKEKEESGALEVGSEIGRTSRFSLVVRPTTPKGAGARE